MKALSPILMLSFLVLAGSPARAHTVETVDGTLFEGKILLEDEEQVVILTTFDGRKAIPRAEVKAIDDSTPPLRDQLKYRADRAKDSVADLWKLHKWAKTRGFQEELRYILMRIVELKPKDAKAHKLLGHEKVDGEWMTADEKEAYLLAQHEEAMRAKGLVLHEGRWVTPEERNAIQEGLVKDGDEYVTEAEYHRRRGEQWVDGAWVKVGEKEGQAWGEAILAGSRVRLRYTWAPNFDLYTDMEPEAAAQIIDAAEGCLRVLRATLRPAPEEMPSGVEGRIRLHVFNKLPAYARFTKFYDQEVKCDEIVKGWGRSAAKQHAWWWVQPIGCVGAYKFPNTTRTVVSNAVHHAAMIQLTQYRFNYRFPAQWLLEGFAYYLEMEAMGYSDTFSVSRGGSAAAAESGKPAWLDSSKWQLALRGAVAEGRDPPMKRLARMSQDQLGYPELVKAWSVVDFMIRLDRAKFEAFIDATKDVENTVDDALKATYGMSWTQLDGAWRAFVSANFMTPAEIAAAEAAAEEAAKNK